MRLASYRLRTSCVFKRRSCIAVHGFGTGRSYVSITLAYLQDDPVSRLLFARWTTSRETIIHKHYSPTGTHFGAKYF